VQTKQNPSAAMPSGDWWSTFFSGLFVELWLKFPTPEMTRAEADLIEKELDLPPGSKLLDIPCGGGRHAVELARRGYQVTGVDISPEFLEHARASVAASSSSVHLEEREMRDLPWRSHFDGAYCVGNSFAYLDDAGNEAFLRSVFDALAPGGRFVLETGVVLESILMGFEKRAWYEVDGLYFLAARRHEALEGRLHVDYTIIRGERVESRPASYRTYSYRELAALLDRTGFRILASRGAAGTEPYSTGERGLRLILEKPAGSVLREEGQPPMA